LNKTTRFPFLFFIAELAYVVWVAFKTYHLDLNHDDDAALFYRLSLFCLIAAGVFFNFEPSTAKYKKLLFIIPQASTLLGLNALFFAVNPKYHGKLDEVKEIITLLEESGADINLPDKRGMTPYACASSHNIPKDILQYLLEHGAY
jgi:hypothetical protein